MQAILKSNTIATLGVAAILAANVACATVIATFDDLATPPALTDATGLEFANGGSLSYKGITWDGLFTVVGDQLRVDPPSGPLFGQPHSPHYFVTNGDGMTGLTMTTSLVLTGAWFGPNEYYGFGMGADQVTIVALSGATELASVVFNLPTADDGIPDPLQFVDTSAFLALSGITGYRIDRREPRDFASNWVADDFQFEVAAVPAPATFALAGIGLLALFGVRRRPAQ